MFSVFSLGHERANEVPERCEVRALLKRGETGWLVLPSGLRLTATGGALWANLSHIRSWDGQEKQPDLGLIHLPQVFCIATFHCVNSYLMRLAQSMLLKCNESAEIRKWKRRKRTERQTWFLLFLPMMHPARSRWLPCISQSPFFGLCPQYSCSIHSKRWDSIHSKSITAQWLTTALFYNHTITIFMRAPADGKTISLHPLLLPPTHPHTSPYLPFSFVVLILFCGPILMKSLMVNHEGIWRGL